MATAKENISFEFQTDHHLLPVFLLASRLFNVLLRPCLETLVRGRIAKLFKLPGWSSTEVFISTPSFGALEKLLNPLPRASFEVFQSRNFRSLLTHAGGYGSERGGSDVLLLFHSDFSTVERDKNVACVRSGPSLFFERRTERRCRSKPDSKWSHEMELPDPSERERERGGFRDVEAWPDRISKRDRIRGMEFRIFRIS